MTMTITMSYALFIQVCAERSSAVEQYNAQMFKLRLICLCCLLQNEVTLPIKVLESCDLTFLTAEMISFYGGCKLVK